MIGEIHNFIRMKMVNSHIHDFTEDMIRVQDTVIIFINHNLILRPGLRLVQRVLIESSMRVSVPVTYMASHQMNDNKLTAVVGIHFLQLRYQNRVIILCLYTSTNIIIHPVLIITGRADGANRGIPDAKAGLI